MARVKITRSRKTDRGFRIVGLFGPSIGYHALEEVVTRIRGGRTRYYVREGAWESDIRVVEEDGALTLESTRNVLSRNNLMNLPDC